MKVNRKKTAIGLLILVSISSLMYLGMFMISRYMNNEKYKEKGIRNNSTTTIKNEVINDDNKFKEYKSKQDENLRKWKDGIKRYSLLLTKDIYKEKDSRAEYIKTIEDLMVIGNDIKNLKPPDNKQIQDNFVAAIESFEKEMYYRKKLIETYDKNDLKTFNELKIKVKKQYEQGYKDFNKAVQVYNMVGER